MFSNNSSNNFDNLLRPERISFGCLSNLETQYVNTVKISKVSKEETDLINLVDDITTQTGNKKINKIDDLRIKELQEFLMSTGTSNVQKYQPLTKEQDEEFQKFFDKYECKTKSVIVANKDEMKNNDACSSNLCMNSYIGIPKVLVPKLNQEHIQEQEHNEDLIDEVLLQKNLEKQHLRNSTNFTDKVIILDNSKLPSPACFDKHCCVEKNNIMDQILSNNNITFTISKVDNKDIYLANNPIFTINKIPKHFNATNEELVSKYNLKYLEAINMNEKIFSNQSTLKSEAEKIHLTPGPTLRYKSIVLPQIMERLNENKTLDDYTDIHRKLVLDTGTFHHKSAEDNALLCLNSSMKTDNLKDNLNFQTRLSSPVQVVTPQHDKISTSSNVTSKANRTPDAFASGSKDCWSIPEKNNNMYGESRFIHIDKLRAMRSEKILANKVKDSIRVGPHILTPPQHLMTDCNKERFVANATSQLFNDFVKGKY